MTSIMLFCFVSNNNWIGASSKESALTSDQVEKGENSLTYFSSIFSNLSRGLPIDERESSSEPSNEQQGEDQEVNANSTVQES
jgi:hypothetical protein